MIPMSPEAEQAACTGRRDDAQSAFRGALTRRQ